ncbi:hypothetical protein PA05_0125 [Cutibacterium acnes P05]|nr:hypothetical protein [Cutibacterium acnes P05]
MRSVWAVSFTEVLKPRPSHSPHLIPAPLRDTTFMPTSSARLFTPLTKYCADMLGRQCRVLPKVVTCRTCRKSLMRT